MEKVVKDLLDTLNSSLERIEKCFQHLSEEQVWRKPTESMNSIGNLCLHLAGNEYQFIISGIGGKPFTRERSKEFTESGGFSKDELLRKLKEIRVMSGQIMESLTEEDLKRTVFIQYDPGDWERMHRGKTEITEPGFNKVLLPLLIKATEHYSYHTGQIVVLTKLFQHVEDNLFGPYH